MKIIETTQGKTVKVDDTDFDWLIKFKWFAHSGGYAATKINGRMVLMHHLIMNTPENMDTDHINRDRSDNCRANLRVCTRAENMQNKSNYKIRQVRKNELVGVNWNKTFGKWEVRLQINKKRRFYGRYKSKQEAIKLSRRIRAEA